jgi:hypothetical protein
VNFLVLPTGQILGVETDAPNMQVLPAQGTANAAWKPVLTGLSSSPYTPGQSYIVQGKQLSGRTQGATYGDDVQANTNFPLVRIVNNQTGHVFYARTHGFTSASVAANVASQTNFTVPATIESGASTLYVVANGIASQGAAVTIQ